MNNCDTLDVGQHVEGFFDTRDVGQHMEGFIEWYKGVSAYSEHLSTNLNIFEEEQGSVLYLVHTRIKAIYPWS